MRCEMEHILNVPADNEKLKEKIVILAKKVEEYRNDEENIKNGDTIEFKYS